jgi:ribokinase
VKQLDLVGCGALNLDLIYRLPRDFPLWEELGPPGTEQLLEPAVRKAVDEALAHITPVRSGGGQAANTTYAMARLGYHAAMVGRVGADDDGAYVLQELQPGDGQAVKRDGETGRVYVLLDENGERRNLVSPGANDQFSPGDLPRRTPRTRFAYFSSFVGDEPLQAQLALLQRLPADVEVAFDPGEIYARKGVKRFLPLLRRCSYFFATEKELEMLCGLALPEALDFVLRAGAGLVVCKMGGRGARLVGNRVDMYVPPLPAEVVDVTGAGDLFAAGFLAAMLEQTGLEAAGRLAAWAASRGIAGLGRSSYPDAEAWQARLAEEREAAESVRRTPHRSGGPRTQEESR